MAAKALYKSLILNTSIINRVGLFLVYISLLAG